MSNLLVTATLAVAMATTAVAQTATETSATPEQLYGWSAKPGKNSIKASALLRTRGGEVRTCAGLQAALIPYSDTAKDYAIREFGSENGGLKSGRRLVDSDFTPFMRETICNAQGEFSFEDLPNGKYYVTATVTWEAPSGGRYSYMALQGGVVAKLVELANGQTKSFVLTQQD